MAELSAKELIERLGLAAHPEGGFYRETYRSPEFVHKSALPGRYSGDRCYSTLVYYFLPKGAKSNLHRLKSDEIWHFYVGGPVALAQIDPKGRIKETMLGHDLRAGHHLFELIPAGSWFGGFPCAGSEYSLIGATVAPGFEFSDFEMGKRADLLKMFPHAESLILKLTAE